jgi:hypothetical protein
MTPTTSKERRQRSGVRQGLVYAFALLVLAGQFSSLAHQLLVQHAVCAEHGELIDVHAGVARQASADRTAANEAAVSTGDSAVGGAEAGDEHCAVLAHRRDQAAGPQRAETLTFVAGAEEPALPSVDAHRPPQVVQLRLAPKQSPPA